MLEVGQRFRSRGRTITETDIVGFAMLSGDTHPQHTDADWAASRPFGGRIAHGMLLVSYAVGLVPFDPERVLALRRISDVVFKRPARIGDTIHVIGRIGELKHVSAEAGLVALRWDIRDGTDRLLCRAGIEVLWAAGEHPHRAPELDRFLDLPSGVIPC